MYTVIAFVHCSIRVYSLLFDECSIRVYSPRIRFSLNFCYLYFNIKLANLVMNEFVYSPAKLMP